MITEKKIDLSIVATIYNDDKNVSLLVNEIVNNTTSLNISYELILVNDNSSDDSEKAIEEQSKKNSFVKGVSLSRNFGQQIAMSAGMRYATGNYVLIMDGDLQNPPSEIPILYNKIKKGYDIVYCVSKKRNNFLDELTSAVFWFFLIRVFNVKIIRNQLMMKIMTREFAERFNSYNEQNRTVTGIIKDIGQHHATVEITNRKRTLGKSNYSFLNRFNLMIDVIISLSNSPLNIMIHLGWIIFTCTFFASIYYIFLYLFYQVPSGFTSILLSIFFFGSLIILMLGIIGRYLANIYLEVKNRPLFHVKKTYNL